MKKAPEEIDPQKYPELACLQAIIHDEDRTPEGSWTTGYYNLWKHLLELSWSSARNDLTCLIPPQK